MLSCLISDRFSIGLKLADGAIAGVLTTFPKTIDCLRSVGKFDGSLVVSFCKKINQFRN